MPTTVQRSSAINPFPIPPSPLIYIHNYLSFPILNPPFPTPIPKTSNISSIANNVPIAETIKLYHSFQYSGILNSLYSYILFIFLLYYFHWVPMYLSTKLVIYIIIFKYIYA